MLRVNRSLLVLLVAKLAFEFVEFEKLFIERLLALVLKERVLMVDIKLFVVGCVFVLEVKL